MTVGPTDRKSSHLAEEGNIVALRGIGDVDRTYQMSDEALVGDGQSYLQKCTAQQHEAPRNLEAKTGTCPNLV